jgi:hypothetical protein
MAWVFAHLAGDAITYFIEPEQDDPSKHTVILVRSIIKTRRKNIGMKEEYTTNDPMLADFFLNSTDLEINKEDEIVDPLRAVDVPLEPVDPFDHGKLPADQTTNFRETNDTSKALPPGEADNDTPLTPEEVERLYDQFEMEDDVNYKFDCILDYEFKDGILILKARYYDDDIGEHDLAVPFPILKRDVPLELARFIWDKVIEDRQDGHYNLWAKSTLKAHARGVCGVYIDCTMSIQLTGFIGLDGQKQIAFLKMLPRTRTKSKWVFKCQGTPNKHYSSTK